jgi:hypothetical protein
MTADEHELIIKLKTQIYV